ncbi:LytR/AlgR family response regulator transcription factor [Desertivirga arenae]|uniref:LytR/AlgR family response regulator transcription factor n=1 Tax=Desertivirga arenae TaxID=2810309 RepID=UPI001A9752DA|nr:LytTR family DNA-binding domain-containing protein [Pedobacter sp. SYSU D00823]
MKIRCIIIDDEPLAREKLKQYVAQVPILQLMGSFEDPVDALMFLKVNSIDLIFLDIQMEQLSGIEFMQVLSDPPKIVITSAYSEYAVQGYEFRVSDYLLKPISFSRFLKATDKVVQELQLNEKRTDFIFIKTEYRMERVELAEITYIEGMKDYLNIVCTKRHLLTLQNFANMEKKLNANFLRVHKSYIVAIDKIRSIERNIIHLDGMQINIGTSYRDRFFQFINSDR